MPVLPFAGFTAQGGTPRPAGAGPVFPVSAEAFGAGEARAAKRLGEQVSRLGKTVFRREEERESRLVQVESAKTSMAFSQELDAAVQTGGDFDAVMEKHAQQFDAVGDNVSTPGGNARMELARARMADSFRGAVAVATAKRTRLETQTQTQELVNILGNAAVTNPDLLPASLAEMDAFVDTFGDLSPEDKALLKQGAFNDLSMGAAKGLLLNDPLKLQEALNEDAIPHIEPAQKASLLGQAKSELARRARSAQSKDELAKLLTRQALDSSAEDHVLTNAEAPKWFEQGVSASQFESARQTSIKAQEARDELNSNTTLVLAGGGVVLNQQDYENVMTRLVTDATKGMEPEAAAAHAINIRVSAAAAGGREDSKLKAMINAGPSGGDAVFASGLQLRAQLQEQSPELLHKMLDSNTRTWYTAYDYMTENLGVDQGAARERLLEVAGNQKETEARLNSKDNRELIADAAESDFPGQEPILRKQMTQRASMYMAIVPTLTAEQAVELAAKDQAESTVVISGGVRAPRRGVPVNWEEADRAVRHINLKRDLRDSGAEVANEDLDDLIFLPNGDGTTAVIGLNGLTIFPAWDWQGAVDEWFINEGQVDFEAEQRSKAQRKMEEGKARVKARGAGLVPELPEVL